MTDLGASLPLFPERRQDGEAGDGLVAMCDVRPPPRDHEAKVELDCCGVRHG